MFRHDECNKRVADESLKAIESYRHRKSDSVFDDFYRSHLDCFEILIEDWKKMQDDYFMVIICREGNKYSNGTISPNYVTICTRPRYISEGVLLARDLYNATKFDLDSIDLYSIFKFVKKKFPDMEFELIPVNKGIFGSSPREVWSNDAVRGNFDKTGEIAGSFVKGV